MELEKEESGFYFGTTSIGYVLAVILVIIPVCILVVKNVIGMWTGVGIGIVASIVLCTLLYPLMLCWVIMLYHVVQAEELPGNLVRKDVTCGDHNGSDDLNSSELQK